MILGSKHVGVILNVLK